jgi:hypothetical protein
MVADQTKIKCGRRRRRRMNKKIVVLNIREINIEKPTRSVKTSCTDTTTKTPAAAQPKTPFFFWFGW